MPLQIRRGTTAQRLTITPLTGELIYDTTTGQLFVGNGSTVGGATTTGISTEDAADAAASLFSTGSHSGITFAYNDAAGRIDATVTVAATGPFDGDLTGSVFADDSTLLVDGTLGALVGPLATSGFSTFGSNASLQDGNVNIVRNTYSTNSLAGFLFRQHHNTADAVNFSFVRSRGTGSAPTTMLNGDDIVDLNFVGHNGTASISGAVLSVIADGSPTVNGVPTKFAFLTNNGTSLDSRAELSSAGVWKINTIQSLTTNSDIAISGNGTGNVNIESVKISGSTISTTDSSSITISQASTFSSNLTVDGTLTIGDSIVQNSANTDYVSTTLKTQGVDRVVSAVQNGTYVQLVSSTAETFTGISYNSTTFRGCRATIKASWTSNNVFIGEVLLANTTTTVTIVTAQDNAAVINTSPISSLTADYNSTTGSIRLRIVTSTSTPGGATYDWTVSYQLFT